MPWYHSTAEYVYNTGGYMPQYHSTLYVYRTGEYKAQLCRVSVQDWYDSIAEYWGDMCLGSME